ncbi:hypothetical protein VNO77_17476 [Canavalia gladiata]|uniref:ABC transporter domain-containing protein n=1 Tax=Canavalia gladiata TaxID=3824 RepID=A0AAN9LNW9_CANGL
MEDWGSFRLGSTSIWRNSDAEIFSNSFHQEDDEEALKWAAIQNLPTFARLRKALLTSPQGEANEIDVHKLGLQEKRVLLERLVRTAEEDNEKFLLKLRDRIDRVGIDLPTIEVRFQHLNVEAEVHVGTRALPTFSNFMVNIVEGLLNSLHILPTRRRRIKILQDVSGIIKPARMTLLLGPPGSGKTTLLLALTAKLDKQLKFSGKVTYNGHEMNEFVPQRTAAYVTQNDLHVGELTVRETLAFSARVQGVGTRYDLLAELSRREKEANIKPDPDIDVYMKAIATEGQKANLITDYVLRILGLEVCADTIVGNAILFRQYLVLVLANQMASALFRFGAAVGRELTMALTLGAFILAILFAMSGFVLSKDYIKKWWLWGFWISPMMYAQNAVVNNEFLGKRWRHVLPNSTEPLGVEILKSRGFFTQSYWYWICIGALVGYTLLFNFCYMLALSYLNPLGKHQAVLSEEHQSNEQNDAKQTESNVMRHIKFSFSQHSNRDWTYFPVTSGESISGSTSPHTLCARQRGMVLPFEPHSITFDEVTYAVDMPQEMRNRGVVEDKLLLLKGVSGAFRPGVLTALMGVTGAGKTTLMDVLAGRKTGGYIGGNISISGYPKKQETFARISGYCEQNDIHSPHVTVYESLLYSAWLRLSPDIDAETRKMFIEEVMELVELKPLRHALVGLPGVNGLSTEQRKRLTIAVELVANPSIIFMDEPTSGLDARAAAIVMRTVRNTVDTGRTVVCTIHQPSIDIFESFDELLLMKQGGEEMYVGPLGHHSSHLISYFEGIQGVNKIKDGYNPATWMLEVTTSAKEMELGIDFAELYKNSELYRRNKALVKELGSPAPGSKDLYFPSQYSTSFFTQCMACLWKQHWSYWRNPLYTAITFIYTASVAVLYGSMFWNLGSKIEKQQDLFNAMGSMYATVLLIGVKNAYAVQPVVAVERTVFYRERAAGMYSALPYAFAQAINSTF